MIPEFYKNFITYDENISFLTAFVILQEKKKGFEIVPNIQHNT